ncbi:MAG: ketoacyl-ACP synthase III [Proteobacteria bacterium]|nr:ketoacyl-ACP synthase III [Pseudomonadota bacterium]
MNNRLPLKVIGVGRYLPERIVTNHEIEEIMGVPEGTINRSMTGVRERRWANGETSSFMGAEAAKEAIDDAGLRLEDVDLILNASGTQEQSIPDGGPLIQRHLGLSNSGIPALSIHATCMSFLVGLNAAANFLANDQYRNVLVVSSDITSVGINPKDFHTFPLFGDVAAAVVVTRSLVDDKSCLSNYVLRTFGEGAYYTSILGGGTRKHPNMPSTKPEDNLFRMDGRRVFLMAVKYCQQILEEVRVGLSKDLTEIKRVVSHQPSGLGLQALKRLGWPEEKIVVTLEEFGNCVSASLPLTLYKAIKEEGIVRGDEILLLGTGAGLTIGAAILTY